MAPRVSDDLHERFVGWLLAGAEGDPPRDVAIHAALCPECGRWIAAQDALAGIDPGRAPLPPSRALPRAPGWRPVVRLAAATGSLLVIGGVGALGMNQLMAQTGTPQEVLAATGTPEATPRAPTGLGGKVTAGAAASQTEAASSPTSTTRRAPRPTRSASATKVATAHAARSVAPTPTSASTATATPTPTATPTDTPTPSPTPTPTPAASL